MNSNKRGRSILSAAIAAAALLGLGGCDQIRSWFSSEPPVAAQPPAPIEVAKAKPPVEAPKPVEPPPVDENKVLAGKVKSALGADPALKMLAIDAGATDGVVTLYGTANNKRNRDKAGKVAAGVPGVKSVKNELVIVAGS
jgi:hyperosmotically inducible periplasmic protein